VLEFVDKNWPGTRDDEAGVAGRCRSRVWAVKVEDRPVKLGRESSEQSAFAHSTRPGEDHDGLFAQALHTGQPADDFLGNLTASYWETLHPRSGQADVHHHEWGRCPEPPEPGVLFWRTASGRTYVTGPTKYRERRTFLPAGASDGYRSLA
jgi:hypothetical protein